MLRDRLREYKMRIVCLLVAATTLFSTSGCSQIVQLETADLRTSSEWKNLTVRTRTGEVYFFEKASFSDDTLAGYAQETKAVYVTGSQVEYITDYRDIALRVDQVEQATMRERNWGKTALLAGVLAGAVAAIAIVAATSAASDDDAPSSGGNPKPPP